MSWRLILAAIISVLAAVTWNGRPAQAQGGEAAPAPSSFSQYLRTNGYSLSEAEVSYLDADERAQAVYSLGIMNVDLLSRVPPEQQNDQWRQALVEELTRLAQADPSAAPPAPPTLQRLRELAIAHRAHIQRAAQQWLAAVQAGDPDWMQRGGDEFRAAGEGFGDWQQELMARFPPPAQAQP